MPTSISEPAVSRRDQEAHQSQPGSAKAISAAERLCRLKQAAREEYRRMKREWFHRGHKQAARTLSEQRRASPAGRSRSATARSSREADARWSSIPRLHP